MPFLEPLLENQNYAKNWSPLENSVRCVHVCARVTRAALADCLTSPPGCRAVDSVRIHLTDLLLVVPFLSFSLFLSAS